MNNWILLNKKELLNTSGEGIFVSVLVAGIVSVVVFRSILSYKGSVSINGLGKINWDDPVPKISTSKDKNNLMIDKNKAISDLFNKFYEF